MILAHVILNKIVEIYWVQKPKKSLIYGIYIVVLPIRYESERDIYPLAIKGFARNR